MEVLIRKLSDDAIIPTRGSEYAAGYDLYACINQPVCIEPHTTTKISTGISCAIPVGYFGGIFARSGIATKKGLRPSNAVGIIDSDYIGEVIVALHNDTNEIAVVSPNERIAQLVIIPFLEAQFKEVDELPKTVRGDGGFGSTGV